MLENGADINSKDRSVRFLSHTLAFQHVHVCVCVCVCVPPQKSAAIHLCVYHDLPMATFNMLLNHKDCDVNLRDSDVRHNLYAKPTHATCIQTRSPLSLAASQGRIPMVQALLAHPRTDIYALASNVRVTIRSNSWCHAGLCE